MQQSVTLSIEDYERMLFHKFVPVAPGMNRMQNIPTHDKMKSVIAVSLVHFVEQGIGMDHAAHQLA
jgi:hypothetical protein